MRGIGAPMPHPTRVAPVSNPFGVKAKNWCQHFRLSGSWSTKDLTARETKDIREDHLNNAFGPTDRA